MAAHTSFRQGQPVIVHLKSGDQFVDKFIAKHSRHIELERTGRVRTDALRAVSIYRAQPDRKAST